MKQLFTFVLAAMAFVACTQNDVEELTANRADVPETLTVGFEGGDTRIELNEALKTVWTEGDEVSVFYLSDANQKWQYQGETGERLGTLKCVDRGVAEEKMQRVVVAYPYNAQYVVNTDTHNLYASLPAVQSYKEGSYGSEGNIMVAQSEFTQFSLKSVCGWLRVELTGEGQIVKSITLRGNAGEQVAGLIYVDTATAEATLASEMGEASDEEQVGGVGGGLEFDDTVFTEVTLDCGDGVELGAEAKEFYIALLPQTFEKGMTIEVGYANAEHQTLVCENNVTIRRNHISPIESEANVEVEVPTNQLWYTATAKVEPYFTSAFNVFIVSNEWDEATGEGIITFDGELTTIGGYAFYDCTSLTSVTIPDSVTTIGDYAFSDCDSLTSVTIGDSVTSIGNSAFSYCSSLTSITIPDSVTTIGERAFFWCSRLTNVTIPDSVTTIGDEAFEGCSSLTSVAIPDSVTTIGEGVFGGCSNLAEFKGKFAADGGRCLIKDNTFIAYAEASGTTYTIPDSVTTIGYEAFRSCYDLTSITIPDSVTTIVDAAFFECRSLTSVTIPDSVTTIGEWAFSDCISLTSVYCKATTPPSLGDYVFKYWDSGYVNIDCAIYVPAESVEAYKAASGWSDYAADIIAYDFDTGEEVAISKKLFYTATALVEPDEATAFNVAIVSNEWDEATGEGVITFDGELTEIGGYAFSDCNSLTSVTIPDSVTTIGNGAFYHCISLTSVTIPDSVTTIGDGVFCCCHSLAEFNGKFATDGGRCLIIDGVLNAFAIGCGAAEYTIPDSITTIGNSAFYYCTSLTSVTIPDSVTTIGEYAFYYCDSLTSVTIPDSVTTIGYEAFERCSSLTSVYCEATTPPTLGDSYVFDYNASGRKIYVTAESVKAYKAAENWSEYAADIVGYNFATGEVAE